MVLFVVIISLLIGWAIADFGYINGIDYKGALSTSFIRFLKPKNFNWLLTYVLTSIITVGLGLNCFGRLLGHLNNTEILLLFIQTLVGYILIHAAIVDLVCFQIITIPITFPLVVILIINSILAISGRQNNIIAGTIAAIFMFLIIKITKKKGMGEGDLLVFTLMGLALGTLNLIVAFYVMVISGSLIGLIIGVQKRKIKGVKIPFVPFMLFGYLVVLMWGDRLVDLYLSLFNI